MSGTTDESGEKAQDNEQSGPDRRQIGPRVDPLLWKAFKQFSEDKHGKQGMTSEELQVAMREHINKSENGKRDKQIANLSEGQEIINAKLDSLLLKLNQ